MDAEVQPLTVPKPEPLEAAAGPPTPVGSPPAPRATFGRQVASAPGPRRTAPITTASPADLKIHELLPPSESEDTRRKRGGTLTYAVTPRMDSMMKDLLREITHCAARAGELTATMNDLLDASRQHHTSLEDGGSPEMSPVVTPNRGRDRGRRASGQERDLTPQEDRILEKIELLTDRLVNETGGGRPYYRQRRNIFFGLIGAAINGIRISTQNRRINNIKKNVKVLRENQDLQEEQIGHLATYLNLTMAHVFNAERNQHVLMQHTRTIALELSKLHNSEQHQWDQLEGYLLIKAEIHQVRNMLDEVEKLVTGMIRVMGSVHTHTIDPDTLPPKQLQEYLRDIQADLTRSHPRLRLPGDFEKDIWTYYATMSVTPVLVEDFVMLACEIPLVDHSLQLHLYRVHNLPALHPQHNLLINYDLEGKYFAMTQDRQFVTIPDDTAVQYCELTHSHTCQIAAPLYPRRECKWCVCALFDDMEKDSLERVREQCWVGVKNATKNTAVNLAPHLWAVVAKAAFSMTVVCPVSTSHVYVNPPVTILNISEGCRAHSSDLYLPSTEHLSMKLHVHRGESVLIRQIQALSAQYTNLTVWHEMKLDNRALDEIVAWKAKELPYLPPTLPLGVLAQNLKDFEAERPWYKNWQYWVFGLMGLTVLAVIAGVGLAMYVVGPPEKLKCLAKVCQRFGKKRYDNVKTSTPSLNNDPPSTQGIELKEVDNPAYEKTREESTEKPADVSDPWQLTAMLKDVKSQDKEAVLSLMERAVTKRLEGQWKNTLDHAPRA